MLRHSRYVVGLTDEGMRKFKGREYECFMRIHSPSTYDNCFNFNPAENGYRYKKTLLQSEKTDTKINYPGNFMYRYSAEYQLSEGEFKSLLHAASSEWHGHRVLNPAKVPEAEHTLREKLVGVYIDVYNSQTQCWERDCEVSSPELCTCVLI